MRQAGFEGGGGGMVPTTKTREEGAEGYDIWYIRSAARTVQNAYSMYL